MEFPLIIDNNPKKTEKLNEYEIFLANKQFPSENTYLVNIDDDIVEAKQYREIIAKLLRASSKDIFIIHITSWGGLLSTATLLIDALLSTKARTKAVIHTAASAATLIAFACDEIEVSDTATVMLHNFSVVQQGKGSEVRAKSEFDERMFKALCEKLYQGILTDTEINKLQDDTDIWMLGSELKGRMLNLAWKPVRGRVDATDC